MAPRVFTLALVSLLHCSGVAQASVLTFIPQFDSVLNGTNYNWFYPQNWFTPDLQGNLEPAGRVPLANETAVITGMADAGVSGVRVQTLVLTNAAVITNGTFSIQNLHMLDASAFKHSGINLVGSMAVNGINCVLSASTLNMLGLASASVGSLIPGGAASLILRDGSLIDANGLLHLANGSTVTAEGAPPSRIFLTGTMTSAGETVVNSGPEGNLVLDNSGLIRVQEGTLAFQGAIDWESTYGYGEFQAAATNSLLLFSGPLEVPSGATNAFTGPGVSRIAAGATVDGLLQVGTDAATASPFTSGCLEAESNMTGQGQIDVRGAATGEAVFRWKDGALSVPLANVTAAGQLVIMGSFPTSHRLVGCELKNSGHCVFSTSELALENAAEINNLTGAVFEIATDGALIGAATPSGGRFNNVGTVLKTSPGVASFGSAFAAEAPDLNNAGVVEVRQGELRVFGGTSSQEFHTEVGATLSFWGGVHTLRHTVRFTGTGAVHLEGIAAPARWLANEGVAVPTLQLGTNGTVVGGGLNTNSAIQIKKLFLKGNGTLDEGIYQVDNVEVSDRPQVTNSTIQVASTFQVLNATCALAHATLRLQQASQANLNSLPPGTATTLSLFDNSTILIEGVLKLAGNSQISGEGPFPNKFVIAEGALLSCTNLARLGAGATGQLLLDHSGVIRVHQGSLVIDGAVDFTSSTGFGRFETAEPNALLVFATPIAVPESTIFAFGGSGTNRFVVGGNIAGRVQIGFSDPSTLQFKPGIMELRGGLNGSGLLHLVGNDSQGSILVWADGRLGLASLSIDAGATLLLSENQGQKELFGCTINNAGLCSWSGQPLAAGAGALFNVLATGKLDIQSDSSITYNQVGSRLTIRNSGVISKSGGGGETSLAADVVNHGNFELATGTLRIEGALAQSSGRTELQAGATLAAPVFRVDGGTISGSGRINAYLISSSAVLMPGGDLGLLTVGNLMDYQQGAKGKLQVDAAGSTPGITYDQLLVEGKASLSGTLEVHFVNGFVPQVGQSLEVLRCGSLLGKFSSVIAASPVSTAWVTRYTGTNVLMLLAQEVTIGPPAFAAGQLRFAFPTTPGVLYQLQACPAVNGAWQDLQIVPGDGTVQTIIEEVGAGSRFFRLLCK